MAKFFKFIGTVILFAAVCAGCIAGYLYYTDTYVKTTNYTIVSKKLTSAENGGKIAVIADYHNSDNYPKILDKIKKAMPDVIVIAGDYINMNDTDFTNANALMSGLVKLAPVYFVSGNHERWLESGEDKFLKNMESLGAINLNMKSAEVPIKDGKITITGYQDVVYADDDMRIEYLNAQLEGIYSKLTKEQKSLFNVLVFHRGNLLHNAARQPYDLILSGHLHGGQVNIPKIRERILEEKTGSSEFRRGYYNVDGVKAVISGGLENNNKPRRIFNMPEVVVITLKALEY
ncbi:MAG: metallophosphoesterase [Clostridia bacterium]|nr:metallophosphoesterase [Clostridia bacterium]